MTPENQPVPTDIDCLPDGDPTISLDDRLREVEARLIAWALTKTGGNKSKAAQLLRVKRSTLGDRINRCGLGPGGPAEAEF